MSSPCIACYIPPENVCNPTAFLTNLNRFKPQLPLILFSDADASEYTGVGAPIQRMRASPEIACVAGQPKWPTVSNMVFLTACILAQRARYTHMIYLEEDCRVVEEWDTTIWNEYVAAGKPHACGGSLVLYHTHVFNGRSVRDAEALVAKNWERNVPVARYGTTKAEPPHRPAVFPNGALGVYPIDVLDQVFEFSRGGSVNRAREMAAYDHVLGWWLCAQHGPMVFDHVVQLNSVLSTYKDQVVPFEARQQWLVERKFVAIHPVKNDWTGPDTLAASAERPNVTSPDAGLAASKSVITDDGNATVPDAASTATHEASGTSPAGTEGRSAERQPQADAPSLRMDILIVTFAPDAWWLEKCLASIAKFATGFGAVHVAYPNHQESAFAAQFKGFPVSAGLTPLLWHGYDEAPSPLGHLDHNVRKCLADAFCPEADLIAHIDSDCFIIKPMTPADFMVDGKPVLLIESFDHLKTEHPGRYAWKAVVDTTLNIDCKFETMVRHPAVHWRGLYPLMRKRIEDIHGKPFSDYVLSCKPDRPCGFAEFPTLGAYALGSKYYRDKYHFIDVTGDISKRPHEKLLQFWSRQNPELEQTIWVEGKKLQVVPSAIINKVLK